jgi:hypothetical protein
MTFVLTVLTVSRGVTKGGKYVIAVRRVSVSLSSMSHVKKDKRRF